MNEKELSYDASAIYAGFNEHCDASSCEGCIYNHCDYLNLCIVQYTHDILTGKMKLSDSFHKKEPKPEPKLPAWCKEGQWVTESHPAYSLGVINGVFVGGRIGVTWKHHKDRVVGSSTPAHTVKPIRFRPYSFEESKGLLGKVMEYSRDGYTPRAELVVRVTPGMRRLIEINHENFDILVGFGATIDGTPIGIPEVDEEAMKGYEDGQA